MVNPVPGVNVSTQFHARGSRWSCNKNNEGKGFHTGVDIKADVGTPVVAARPGVTAHVNYGTAFGSKQLVVRCDDGTEDFYAHMSGRVGKGIQVGVGHRIGAVGKEGNVTGPHLHFERHREQGLWSCNNCINPQPSLDFMVGVGVASELGLAQPEEDDMTPEEAKAALREVLAERRIRLDWDGSDHSFYEALSFIHFNAADGSFVGDIPASSIRENRRGTPTSAKAISNAVAGLNKAVTEAGREIGLTPEQIDALAASVAAKVRP